MRPRGKGGGVIRGDKYSEIALGFEIFVHGGQHLGVYFLNGLYLALHLVTVPAFVRGLKVQIYKVKAVLKGLYCGLRFSGKVGIQRAGSSFHGINFHAGKEGQPLYKVHRCYNGAV